MKIFLPILIISSWKDIERISEGWSRVGSLAWFTSVKRLTAFWRRSTTFRGRRVWKVEITNLSRCLFQKLLTDEPEMPIFRFCSIAIQNPKKRSPGLSSYLYLK